MRKQDIEHKLKDNGLTNHERETLLQLLHYLTVEGLDHTSSNESKKSFVYSSKSKNSSKNYTSSNKNKRSS